MIENSDFSCCGGEETTEKIKCNYIATFNNFNNVTSLRPYVPAFQGIIIEGQIYYFSASIATITNNDLEQLKNEIITVLKNLGYNYGTNDATWKKNAKGEVEIYVKKGTFALNSLYSAVKPFPSINFRATCDGDPRTIKTLPDKMNVKTVLWLDNSTLDYEGGPLNKNGEIFCESNFITEGVKVAVSYRFTLKSVRISGVEKMTESILSPEFPFSTSFRKAQSGADGLWYDQTVSDWLNTLKIFKKLGIFFEDNGGIVYSEETVELDLVFRGEYLDQFGSWNAFLGVSGNTRNFGISTNDGYGYWKDTVNDFSDIPLIELTSQQISYNI